jgi:hypothetical protein
MDDALFLRLLIGRQALSPKDKQGGSDGLVGAILS